jgi:hypothetical protein
MNRVTKDVLKDIFINRDTNEPSVRVSVDSLTAQSPTIYNLSVTATVQNSQAITDGSKKILIKPRDIATIKLSYDNSFTTFLTIPAGNAYEIKGISSSSLTLYFESDTTTVIEIEQWS